MNFPRAVLITGANGGIGSHVVDYFLQQGVRNVVCHARSGLDSLLPILRRYDVNPDHHCFTAELTDEAQVQKMREQVVARFGDVWGVVNFAGCSSNSMVWKLSSAEFMKVVSANLLSTFHVTKEFLAGMRAANGGRIINISSVVAHTGIPGASHYCAAKAGIEGFTKSVALEVANKGITVNCVAMGYFNYGLIQQVPEPMLTEIKGRIPLKRLGQASEIGSLLGYLLSEEAGFVTGQIVHANGGQYG